jgi:hypothetical protein
MEMVIMMLLVIEINKFFIQILILAILGGPIIGENVTDTGHETQIIIIIGNIIQVLG